MKLSPFCRPLDFPNFVVYYQNRSYEKYKFQLSISKIYAYQDKKKHRDIEREYHQKDNGLVESRSQGSVKEPISINKLVVGGGMALVLTIKETHTVCKQIEIRPGIKE